MESMIEHIDRNGEGRLALRLPSATIKGAGAVFARALSEEGFVVEPGDGGAPPRIEAWKFEGIEEEGGSAMLFGPAFDGPCFDDLSGLREGMGALGILVRALSALQSEGKLARGLASPGILVSGAGGGEAAVLVLPPAAVAKALASSGPEVRAAAVARFQSPASKGCEADASFLLAQAAYRFASGSNAFDGDAADEGNMASPRLSSVSAVLAAPRLDPDLAALIDAALADPNRVSLGAWAAALDKASASGWERELPPDREAELARRRVEAEAEAGRKRRREAFFRKRGGLIVGLGIALVAAGLVATDIVRAQLDKPNFSNLPPAEVARHYYAAIDGLDLDSLEACGRGDATKPDRDVVMNLVVLTKTRMAYESRNPLLPAKDWIARGKSQLKESDFLYGIVDLVLADEGPGSGPGTERLRASYSIWSLDRIEDPSGDPGKGRMAPMEEKRTDELLLRQGKRDGWKIVELRRSTSR